MSLTGANADERFAIKPSEESAILLNLYNKLASKSGLAEYPAPSTRVDTSKLANELLKHKGKSLVVSGTNDYPVQLIVNAINALLGNYQHTIDLATPMYIRQGDDMDMTALVNDMHSGKVGAIIMNNVNPAYDFTGMKDFAEGLGKVGLVVSTADRKDETAEISEYVCPDNHYLESWNDAEPRKGYYSMTQPAIRKIFNTRQFQDSLLKWMGREENYADYLETHWEQEMFPRQNNFLSFSEFWHHCIHDGVWHLEAGSHRHPDFITTPLKAEDPDDNGLELVLYETMGIGCGKHANNPWLQELPDPITTAVWDNYICIPPKYAEENGIEHEDVLSIDGQVELPALIQPGQAEGTIAVALGYGRTVAGKVADGIGQNMYPFISYAGSNRILSGKKVQLQKLQGKTYPLATTQVHHTMEGRPIVRETTLKEWQEKPNSGNEMHMNIVEQNLTLYEIPEYDAFHWGMAINLNACIGCGNCVISCQAENNVAVIGKEEIRNRRMMHWIRIDRYYSENAENPEVVHQPVLCQHCDNAPCENVCPVAATPHNDEGLNQMAYNRCIGTRYCMNNCPYKVRRFNWFEFANNDKFNFNMNSEQEKLVLNPDVTVRSRGVVEKCSFCVQRIQEKKLLAKKEGRQLDGNEVKTACQQSCPGNAIVFGNMNDPDSEISKLMTNPRTYQLLEQLHTLPSVSYMTKVRNKEKIMDSSARAAGSGHHSSH
jgi:molybdopterin-containing oxidoreductase family iron-sulfur binding subunit